VPGPEPSAIEDFGSSHLAELVLEAEWQNKLSSYFGVFGTVLRECKFTNPRKIKRILNRYLLFLAKFETTLSQYVITNVVKLHIMAEYFPALFQLYLTEGAAVDRLRDIGTDHFNLADFERDTGVSFGGAFAQLTRMRQLFQLNNPLPAEGKVDLRKHAVDVFSIARLK
jgi:hypothetical protein